MSSSTNDNSNSGKATKPDKPKENSSLSKSPSLNLSEYIGLPKAQAVHSYVKSVYGWIYGPTSSAPTKNNGSNQSSPPSSSTANITLAESGTKGDSGTQKQHRKIAVHPSQNKETFNIISMNKPVTADGEPLSQNVGSSSETSSNNTTETPFSDLSTTPSDLTVRGGGSATTVTGKEKEEDSWSTNMKDVKSDNETVIHSSKSDSNITTDLASEKPLSAAPKSAEKPPAPPQEDIQFSFMNQLRELEDEKNKEFLVPDQVYFGGRENVEQVHKPNSQKMVPKPSSTTTAVASVIPPISNVKNFLSNLLPDKKPSSTSTAAAETTDNKQKNDKTDH